LFVLADDVLRPAMGAGLDLDRLAAIPVETQHAVDQIKPEAGRTQQGPQQQPGDNTSETHGTMTPVAR
jgi:hypothetical protein